MSADTILWNSLTESLWLFAGSFGGVLLLSLLARLSNGATGRELIQTRFYEIPPLRGLIHVLHVAMWLIVVSAGCITLAQGVAIIKDRSTAHVVAALLSLVFAVIAALCGWRWHVALVRISGNRPPQVDVSNIDKRRGIPPYELKTLGRERFPNTLAQGWKRELYVRGLLTAMCAAVIGAAIYGATENAYGQSWRTFCLATLERVGSVTTLPSHGLGLFVAVTCFIALLLLVLTNASYSLLTFGRTLGIQAVLTVGMFSGAATLSWKPEALAVVLAMIAGVCGLRWLADLRKSSRYRRMKGVYDSIAAAIRTLVPGIDQIARRPDCQLVPVDDRLLVRRISQGCRNVEEADLLVTRNFARFMSLVTVEHEHFVAAMLRYLTVRRYVSESGGAGTARWLQDPSVPAWDESLFPLHAPRGFVDWIDPLLLDSEWDRVSICGSCGGSGQVSCSSCGGSGTVQRTETYTEYSGGQSHTRTRERTETCSLCCGSGKLTCSSCRGFGKLEFNRTLNTQWQRLMPAVIAPAVPMPELLEDAEERVYYRQPLVEDRVWLDVPAQADRIGSDLVAALDQAKRSLAEAHDHHRDQVMKLHDGQKLYRADFQVTGFWTLCIHFLRLRGKLGWFFGARPEFYFPRLPLSWSLVGTILFLPPLLAISAILTAGPLSEILRQVLPPLP